MGRYLLEITGPDTDYKRMLQSLWHVHQELMWNLPGHMANKVIQSLDEYDEYRSEMKGWSIHVLHIT
jgi:hypothetical protein